MNSITRLRDFSVNLEILSQRPPIEVKFSGKDLPRSLEPFRNFIGRNRQGMTTRFLTRFTPQPVAVQETMRGSPERGNGRSFHIKNCQCESVSKQE